MVVTILRSCCWKDNLKRPSLGLSDMISTSLRGSVTIEARVLRYRTGVGNRNLFGYFLFRTMDENLNSRCSLIEATLLIET